MALYLCLVASKPIRVLVIGKCPYPQINIMPDLPSAYAVRDGNDTKSLKCISDAMGPEIGSMFSRGYQFARMGVYFINQDISLGTKTEPIGCSEFFAKMNTFMLKDFLARECKWINRPTIISFGAESHSFCRYLVPTLKRLRRCSSVNVIKMTQPIMFYRSVSSISPIELNEIKSPSKDVAVIDDTHPMHPWNWSPTIIGGSDIRYGCLVQYVLCSLGLSRSVRRDIELCGNREELIMMVRDLDMDQSIPWSDNLVKSVSSFWDSRYDSIVDRLVRSHTYACSRVIFNVIGKILRYPNDINPLADLALQHIKDMDVQGRSDDRDVVMVASRHSATRVRKSLIKYYTSKTITIMQDSVRKEVATMSAMMTIDELKSIEKDAASLGNQSGKVMIRLIRCVSRYVASQESIDLATRRVDPASFNNLVGTTPGLSMGVSSSVRNDIANKGEIKRNPLIRGGRSVTTSTNNTHQQSSPYKPTIRGLSTTNAQPQQTLMTGQPRSSIGGGRRVVLKGRRQKQSQPQGLSQSTSSTPHIRRLIGAANTTDRQTTNDGADDDYSVSDMLVVPKQP